MRLTLKVTPGAKKTQFAGRHGHIPPDTRHGDAHPDVWKLRVAAPPVDGKANEAIVRFLAAFAGVPVSRVRIVTGHASNLKIAEIDGVESAALTRAILETHATRNNPGSAAT